MVSTATPPGPLDFGRDRAHVAAALLGLAAFLVSTVTRFLRDLTGLDYGAAGELFVVGIAVSTALAVAALAARGGSARGSATVVAGPVVGVGAFLCLHALVFGPSSDSPTWLVYLAFAAAVFLGGAVAHAAGRAVGVVARGRGENET